MFGRSSPSKLDEARAKQFGIKLSQIGRIVFRGVGGVSALADKIGPDPVFKKGFDWNWDGLDNAIDIKPKIGIQRGAISTTKLVNTAIHYGAQAMKTNQSSLGWLYAIYCRRGVDYASAYINNPLLGQAPLPKGLKTGTNATLTPAAAPGGVATINMSRIAANNEEIIMISVQADEVICCRPIVRTEGMAYLAGNVMTNPKNCLRKDNPQLLEGVVTMLANYDLTHDMDWVPDGKKA